MTLDGEVENIWVQASFTKDFRLADRQNQEPDERYRGARAIAVGVMVPSLLVACVIVGCLLGYYADKKFDTTPWLTLLGLVLGSAAGVREMLKLLKKIQSDRK